MTKCSICRLEPAKKQAIDAALAAGVSLDELARRSGLGRSSLGRHGQHAPGAADKPALVKPENPPERVQVPRGPLTPPLASVAVARTARPSKEQLLERIELLWGESMDGLSASKEPIQITKPDGTQLEIPGDLRARAGFLREARSILALQGEANGDLKGDDSLGTNILIVCAGTGPGAVQADDDITTIDIGQAAR